MGSSESPVRLLRQLDCLIVHLALLLLANIVLRASLDASALYSVYGLFYKHSGEVRIRAETFPVTTPERRSAQSTYNRPECYVSAFVSEFRAHIVSALANQRAVPGSCGRDPSREDRDVDCLSNSQRSIV